MADPPTTRYDPGDDESLSTAIVSAISRAKGRDITEDTCVLYDNIDPDGLDKLFRNDSDENTIKVEFTTHDAIVLVWGNGKETIEVQDLEPETSRQ